MVHELWWQDHVNECACQDAKQTSLRILKLINFMEVLI